MQVPADTADKLCTETDRILPEANAILEQIKNAIETVVSWIRQGIELIGGFIGTTVASALEKALADFQNLLKDLEKMVEEIRKILEGVMMPWILPEYADKWRKISALMTDIARKLGPQDLRSSGASEWTGEAAQKYRELADTYKETALFAEEIAHEHGQLLDESANSAQQLYFALLGFIVSIIITLIILAIEIAGVVTAPVAVATAVAALLPLIAEVIAVIDETLNFINQQESAFHDIKKSLDTATVYFPNKTWPTAGG